MTPSERADAEHLRQWVEAEVGGTVTRIERLARWRPAWDIDVDLGGVELPLHARGEREANFAIPYRIADEVPTHDLLEAASLPVPHAYGLCPQPYALVMDRLPGFVDLSFAADDTERRALLDEYLHLLPAIYGIDLGDAAAAGFDVPADARGAALDAFIRWEEVYDALMPEPDPVSAFLRRWLHRNYPRHRPARFITYDAFQFMFADGRITGLLDFELAHVGDPMKDLAALRVRETIKNLGDLPAIAERYAEITGVPVDHDAVDYHTVMYNAITVLSAAPPLAAPAATTDYVSHMAWWVNSARWALEVIADIEGIALSPVEALGTSPSTHHEAHAHLVRGLRARAATDRADYQLDTLHKLARHLARVDEAGAAAQAGDLDDLAVVLGRRVDPADAERSLLDTIASAGPERDADLVGLLERRVQRMHLLMAPPDSLMIRHPTLRSIRPGAMDDGTESWPAGSIPGTR